MGRVYARVATPRPSVLSQRRGVQALTEVQKRSAILTVRMTPNGLEAINALAAIAGVSNSRYVETLLNGEVERPRPTLAAAGALLSICSALIHAARREEIDATTHAFVLQQAKLVISILKAHGDRGLVT